jgi:hypothetical protein
MTIAEAGFWMNRAFSADLCACVVHGALPHAHMRAAPLALNRYWRAGPVHGVRNSWEGFGIDNDNAKRSNPSMLLFQCQTQFGDLQ